MEERELSIVKVEKREKRGFKLFDVLS